MLPAAQEVSSCQSIGVVAVPGLSICMSQIYLNGIFSSALQADKASTSYTLIPADVLQWSDSDLPHSELIGIVLWSMNEAEQIVHRLLPKTNQLMIYLPEPTITYAFVNFVKTFGHDKITMFGNASLNFPAPNYQTVPNWFVDHVNLYATTARGRNLFSQLTFEPGRPKKFDCLLGTKKHHRDLIERLYTQSPVQDDFIFSYFKDNMQHGIWSHTVDAKSLTVEKVHVPRVDAHDPRLVRICDILPVEIYNQSYYSIVAETVCTNDYSHYTEKTAKPMIAKRIFVMFSGQYFLRNLQSLGFKTFHGIIDESYDAIQDVDARFTAAWNQVEWLCRQDPDQIMSEVKAIVDHNHQHFMSTNWHEPIFSAVKHLMDRPGFEPVTSP